MDSKIKDHPIYKTGFQHGQEDAEKLADTSLLRGLTSPSYNRGWNDGFDKKKPSRKYRKNPKYLQGYRAGLKDRIKEDGGRV